MRRIFKTVESIWNSFILYNDDDLGVLMGARPCFSCSTGARPHRIQTFQSRSNGRYQLDLFLLVNMNRLKNLFFYIEFKAGIRHVGQIRKDRDIHGID